MDKINGILAEIFIGPELLKAVFSAQRKKSLPYKKVTIRPVLIKGIIEYQFEYTYEKKVTHENLAVEAAEEACKSLLLCDFKQINIYTKSEEVQILAAKPDRPRIVRKNKSQTNASAAGKPDTAACAAGTAGKLDTSACAAGTAGKPDTVGRTDSPADIPGAAELAGLLDGAELERLSHNRKKKYIIEDGKPCDFLVRLGVMDEHGKVFQKHYGKFRQINRYLEIVRDVLPYLKKSGGYSQEAAAPKNDAVLKEATAPKEATASKKAASLTAAPQSEADGQMKEYGPLKIIDFGCGKAYLTFALYYYLKIMQGFDVEIIGLDLKDDVIRFCGNVASDLGYEGLTFLRGDIADYTADSADMVVTLHACDTATDYALINAVNWNSKVILSVPCCQHELFSQIKSETLSPLLKHGIIKDRFTEILTDGIRGLALESAGYDVAMIEFTSLEHTARNIMIKAVKGRARKAKMDKARAEYAALKETYHIEPTIDCLFV